MIICFSATGNSRYVADRIAEATDDNVIMVRDVIDGDCNFEDRAIGIVCPVHFYGLPIQVEDLIAKMNVKCQYSFLVMTYGTFTCNALSDARKKLAAKGMEVQYSATIHMPENYIIRLKAPDDDKERMILDAAEPLIDQAIEAIRCGNASVQDRCRGPRLLYSRLMRSIFVNGRSTDKFRTNDGCTGCGKCRDVCPMHAIDINDGKPLWAKERCLKCLACINTCPSEAIEFGNSTKGKKRYQNPRVNR